MKEIEEAANKSYEEQCHEETSAYECFFHYTDEKLYSAGFIEGIKFIMKDVKNQTLFLEHYKRSFAGYDDNGDLKTKL